MNFFFKKILLGTAWLTFMFLFPLMVYSQHPVIKISFGEKISPSQIQSIGIDEALWTVIDEEGIENTKGKSLNLFDVVFEKPGMYSIKFQHDHSQDHANTCNHYEMPDMIKINVSAQKITYDFSGIKFSKPINGGADVSGLIMSVPVKIINLKNEEAIEIPSVVNSFGIKTTITGFLKNGSNPLKPGLYNLEFELKGKATAGTYLGFDFTDFNGNVIPFGLTDPIK